MGGVRQAAIRRTRTGPQVFGALRPTSRDLQSSSAIAGKRPGPLRMEELLRREPEQNDDAACGGVHPPFSSPRAALRLRSYPPLRLSGQSQTGAEAGVVPLLATSPANRRAHHKNWRTGASPLPDLQGRPVGVYRETHGRGTCLFGGAHDRRHFMTAMSTPSTKSWPTSLAPVTATGDPCPNPPPRRSGNTGSDCHPLFHRRAISSPGVFPSVRQTECHSIPIAHVPAQFNEFYR